MLLLLMLDDGSGWELCKPAAAKLAGVPGTTAGRLREALPPRDGKHKAFPVKAVRDPTCLVRASLSNLDKINLPTSPHARVGKFWRGSTSGLILLGKPRKVLEFQIFPTGGARFCTGL